MGGPEAPHLTERRYGQVMADHPYTKLSPADAAVALRSLERRFRDAATSAVVTLDDEPDEAEIDEIANRTGADGRSAIDHVVAARIRIDTALTSLQKALVSPSHQIDTELLELGLVGELQHSGRLSTEIDTLATSAATLAETVDSADVTNWVDERSTTSGSTSTPLAIVQATVAFSLDRLQSLEAVLREVRGHPTP